MFDRVLKSTVVKMIHEMVSKILRPGAAMWIAIVVV